MNTQQLDEMQYSLEMASFAEKIALSKLEVKKAQERVAELEYEQARFHMEFLRLTAKKMQTPPEPPK